MEFYFYVNLLNENIDLLTEKILLIDVSIFWIIFRINT